MAVSTICMLSLIFRILISVEGKAINVLDMSRVYDNQSIYWPQGQQNYFEHEVRVDSFENVDWIQRGTFSSGEHGGTHIDAPIHFARGTWTLEEIPLDRLMALPVVVLDVRAGVQQDDDYLASAADAQRWETENGKIPDGAVVLLCTGWEWRWPNITLVYGNAQADTANYHYPGFGGDLCEWMVNERNVYGVGTDGPSIEGAASLSTVVAHQTLYKYNIWGLEQMIGVCQLPLKGATLTALPMRIGGGSGGPVRVVAMWGQEECATGSGNRLKKNLATKMFTLAILLLIGKSHLS